MIKQLAVIGGGAAGFFCAVNAARMYPGLRVTIIEKSGKLLSKVKVSGGGRCNVTHDCRDILEMSLGYPRGRYFTKKLFHQFFTVETIEWFKERGVPLKTEVDGRMFPVTDSSQTIIDCLLHEASRYGVEIMLNAEVKELKKNEDGFTLILNNDRKIMSDFVCVATGGYPKSDMFNWLKRIGHPIEEPVPSLFTFNLPGHPITKLMGLSVENAIIRIAESKLEETGPLLITHWGLSGPLVLRLSAWGARELRERNWEFGISINWTGKKESEVRERLEELRLGNASRKIYSKSEFRIPLRLWEFIAGQAGIGKETRWADLAKINKNKFIQALCMYDIKVNGKTTFKEEFVTAGGIRLSEIDPQTMMSRIVPGLYFAGEVCDVDGITGGYNFQFAWSSGFAVAKSLANSM